MVWAFNACGKWDHWEHTANKPTPPHPQPCFHVQQNGSGGPFITYIRNSEGRHPSFLLLVRFPIEILVKTFISKGKNSDKQLDPFIHGKNLRNCFTQNVQYERYKVENRSVSATAWRPWGPHPPHLLQSLFPFLLPFKKNTNSKGMQGVLTVFRVRFLLIRLHSHTLRRIRPQTLQLPWKYWGKKHQ